MACRLAPNGKKSKVYAQITDNFGDKVADDVYLTMHSNAFRSWFGDWRSMADSLIKTKPGSFASSVNRSMSKMDKITNPTTNEPIVYYTKMEPFLDSKEDAIEDLFSSRGLKVSNKYELGSMPIFIRNNNITTVDTDEANLYNVGFVKSVDGQHVLFNTSDVVHADTGVPLSFNATVNMANMDTKFVSNGIKTMFKPGFFKKTIVDNTLKVPTSFTNGALEHNLDQYSIDDYVMQSIIPLMVNEIFVKHPTKFENLVAELLNTDQIKEMRALHFDKTPSDHKQYALTKVFTDKITAGDLNHYRMPPFMRELQSKVGQMTGRYPIPVGPTTTFASIQQQMDNMYTEERRIPNLKEKIHTPMEKLLPTYENTYQSTTSDKGEAETALDEMNDSITFDDSLVTDEWGKIILSPFTNKPMMSHTYIYNGLKVDKSVSDLKKEFKQLEFDESKYFKDKYLSRKEEIWITEKNDKGKDRRVASGNFRDNPLNKIFDVIDSDGNLDVDATEAKKNKFMSALFQGRIDSYYDAYPINKEISKFETSNPKYTETHENPAGPNIEKETDADYQRRLIKKAEAQIDRLWYEVKDELGRWRMSAFIGTRFHRIAEAVMREEHDRNAATHEEYDFDTNKKIAAKDRDAGILSKLDKLPDALSKLGKEVLAIEKKYKGVITPSNPKKDIKYRVAYLQNQLAKVSAYHEINFKGELEENVPDRSSDGSRAIHPFTESLNTIAAKADHIQRHIQLYEDLKAIKKNIKDKGGIIKVEVNLYNDNVINEKNEVIAVAGQADIVAIYEDKDGVHPDYRGKFELYDYKTMKWPIEKDNPKGYYIYTDEDGNQTAKGYTPDKQMSHALQQLMYARMIEEATGLEFKDSYIIPVTNPQVSMTGKMKGAFGVEVTDYLKRGDDSPLVLNTSTYEGDTLIKDGKQIKYMGFAALRKHSFERIPGKDTQNDQHKGKLFKKGLDKMQDEKKLRKDNDLLETVGKVRVYIETQIDILKKNLKDKDSKTKRNELYNLQLQLQDYQNMDKLWKFALSASDEILGTTNQVALRDRLDNAMAKYYESLEDHTIDTASALKEAIELTDDIRRTIQDYESLLNDIRSAFDDAEHLKEDEDYKRMTEAIKEINTLRKDYLHNARIAMADRLLAYKSGTTDYNVNAHFEDKIQRLQDRLEELEKEGKGDSFSAKSLKADLKQTNKEFNDMQLERDELIKQFELLDNDINWFQRYLSDPMSTSDNILSLYMKMMKQEIGKAEVKLQKKAVEMENFRSELLQRLGKKSADLDAETMFNPILEDRWTWVRIVEDDGQGNKIPKRVLRKVKAFVDPLGTQMHEIQVLNEETGEMEMKEFPLSYTEIKKDYEYNISKLRREDNFIGARKLRKKYDKWKADNMQRQYTDEIYNLEKHWDDTTGQAAKNALDDIDEQILQIKQESQGEVEMSPEDVTRVEELYLERRQLGSLYDNGNNLKKGTSFDIAERIQEYNKDYASLHNFDTNHDLFVHRKNLLIKKLQKQYAGIDIPVTETPEYYDWLDKNQVTEQTPKFYDRYNRLRVNKDLAVYVAIQKHIHGINDEAIDIDKFLIETQTIRTTDKNYNDFVEARLAKHGMTLNDIKVANSTALQDEVQELRDEINQLIKPYKVSGKLNSSAIPRKVQLRVKQLETQISNAYEFGKAVFKGKSKGEKAGWAAVSKVRSVYQTDIDEFVKYVPNNAYYKAYATEELKMKAQGLDITKSKWYQDNHVEGHNMKVDGKNVAKPTSSWMEMRYNDKEKSNETTFEYKAEKAKVILDSMELHPSEDAAFHEAAYKNSPFYKKHHDEKGHLKEGSRFFEGQAAAGDWVTKKPSSRYTTATVKDGSDGGPNYVRTEDAKGNPIFDSNDNLLPNPSQWPNGKYQELQNNDTWKWALGKFMDFYKDAQKELPQHYQMDNIIPFVEKGYKEEMAGKSGAINKAKVFGKMLKDEWTVNAFDSAQFGDITAKGQGLDQRNIPMLFTKDFYAESDLITKDVFSSVMKFMGQAYKHNALSGIMSETRTISALIDDRESSGGKVKKDILGNKYINAYAEKLGLKDYYIRDNEGPTNAAKLFRDVVEMHILGEMSKVSEVSALGKKININKLSNQAQKIAAWTQIGGIASTGAYMKGAVNWLQASTQVMIEQMAGKHFEKNLWKQSNKDMNRLSAMKNAMEDYGKLTPTTLTGQLFSIYDPLQGDFLDKFGKPVSGSKITQLFSGDAWFLNQYIGEWNVAMRTMMSILGAQRVDSNGNVYSKDEFMMKAKAKAKESGKKWDGNAKLLAEQQFLGLEGRLLDAYQINPDTGQMEIKEGVIWEIGSKRDLDLKDRLHSISRDLQGNYSKMGTTAIQRSWWGSLLMMYKKYFAPMLDRRFGGIKRDEERGDINVGYYRSTLGLMVSDFQTFLKEGYFILSNKKELSKLSDLERENLIRAMIESAIIVGLMLVVSSLAPGDDEDKTQISNTRWMSLYISEKLRKESMSLWIWPPNLVEDNYKMIRQPSSIIGLIDKTLNVIKQANPLNGNMFDTYKTSGHGATKGDSKLARKMVKLMDAMLPGGANDSRTMYENMSAF